MNYVRERILEPILIPVVAVALIAFGALNLSRLFLAASHADRAVVVAALISAAILGGAVWATSKERIDRGVFFGAAALLGVVLSGAGLIAQQVDLDRAAEATGEGPADGGGFTSAVEIVAVDIDFPEAEIQAADGGGIEFTLNNQGAALHTFVFEGLEDEFKLEANGGASESGVFALEPADYVFYCDVPGHRAAGMEGTLTVTEGAEAAAGGTEGAEAAEGGEAAQGTEDSEGAEAPTASTTTRAGGGAGTSAALKVVGKDIKFTEKRYEAKAGTVNFELTNEGSAPHTLVVEGREDDMKLETGGGEKDKGSLRLQPGEYVFYCDVPGHRSAGMEADLVVR